LEKIICGKFLLKITPIADISLIGDHKIERIKKQGQ